MKKVIIAAVLVGLMFFPSLGLGQDDSTIEEMNLHIDNPEINSYAEECAYCAAFFSHIALCAGNGPGNESTVFGYESLSSDLLSRSILLSNYETTEARFLMADQEFFQTMDGRCENISRILSSNLDSCIELSNDNMNTPMRILGIGQ